MSANQPGPAAGSVDPTNKPPSDFSLAADKLNAWTPASPQEYEPILKIVQRSLETTTKLTEYEDGKAARVLTAIAFLSGLAGTLHKLTIDNIGAPGPLWLKILVHVAYGIFYGYVLKGSLTLLVAIMPRFNIPKRPETHPFSLTFSPEIARVTLDAWVSEFTTRSAAELQLRSIRNEILEARLIAEKCGKKVGLLQAGMKDYLVGFKVLVAAVCISGYSLILHPLGQAALTALHPTKLPVPPAKTLLIIDADNTLWATNDVFANAQRGLLESVARLTGTTLPADPVSFVRDTEDELAKQNNGSYNIPAMLLAQTLVKKVAATAPPANPPRPAITDAQLAGPAMEFERALRVPPAVYSHVPETLRRLKDEGYRIVLFSESEPTVLDERLRRFDLQKYFERVFQGQKTFGRYKEIGTEFEKLTGQHVITIGDRLDVDVKLPMEAGFKAVWIPASYRPKAANVVATPSAQLNAFSDLPETLPKILAPE